MQEQEENQKKKKLAEVRMDVPKLKALREAMSPNLIEL